MVIGFDQKLLVADIISSDEPFKSEGWKRDDVLTPP